MSEYIKGEDYEELIGKRARFKLDAVGCSYYIQGKTGVIQQIKGMEHIGLSLVFDEPLKRSNGDSVDMDSCYIPKGSIELWNGIMMKAKNQGGKANE
jgi:hypothetical protein